MRISDWSSDVCSSVLFSQSCISLMNAIHCHQSVTYQLSVNSIPQRFLGLCTRRQRFHLSVQHDVAYLSVRRRIQPSFRLAPSYSMVLTPSEILRTTNRSEERRVGKECVRTCRS